MPHTLTRSRRRTKRTKTTHARRSTTTHARRSRTTYVRSSERTPRKNYIFHDFQGLFVKELSELYNLELQLIKTLPQMARIAEASELKHALRDHLKETQEQAKRLLMIFRELGIKPQIKRSNAMESILKDGKHLIAPFKANAKDAAIIAAAQKVEHFEIAAYGIAKAHAKCLNLDSKIIDLLDQSLDEEAAADKRLTKLAEGSLFFAGINKNAVREEELVLV